MSRVRCLLFDKFIGEKGYAGGGSLLGSKPSFKIFAECVSLGQADWSDLGYLALAG